jgi:hypothetical protein
MNTIDVSRRRLTLALRAIGGTAIVAGTHDLLRGAGRVLGQGQPSASVDSELRFGSAWYATAGVLMLRAARGPESEGSTVRLVSAGWLLAATGRVLSIRSSGRPHPFYLVLMGAEFAIPALLVPWQHLVERRAYAGRITDPASSISQ